MEGQIGQGGGQTSVRKIHQAPPLADLQSKLHKLHASCQKKQPSQAKDCKDAMAVAAAKGTAISNVHAEMLDPNSVSHGLAGGRAVLHDGPAEAKGSKGTSHGIKFFHGATLLEKMQAMEKAPVLPASGSKGKTGIKSIQVAEKARLQAEKERERKEAHKKAVQAEVAANKAKRLAEAVLAGMPVFVECLSSSKMAQHAWYATEFGSRWWTKRCFCCCQVWCDWEASCYCNSNAGGSATPCS